MNKNLDSFLNKKECEVHRNRTWKETDRDGNVSVVRHLNFTYSCCFCGRDHIYGNAKESINLLTFYDACRYCKKKLKIQEEDGGIWVYKNE